MTKPKDPSNNPALDFLEAGKARELPIDQCWITKGWRQKGHIFVVVARRHPEDFFTIGFYDVDLFCTGVRKTWYLYHIAEEDYEVLEEMYAEGFEGHEFENCGYGLAHKVVHASLDYATSMGIEPHEDFVYTKNILEDAYDNIPHTDVPLGFMGQPFLITAFDDPRAGYYLKKLHENVGEGNFKHSEMIGDKAMKTEYIEDDWEDSNDDFYDYTLWSEMDWEIFLMGDVWDELNDDPDLADYIFSCCLYRIPEELGSDDRDELEVIIEGVQIEEDEEAHPDLSQKELDTAIKMFKKVDGIMGNDPKLEKLKKEIEALIEKQPKNYMLYVCLTDCFEMLDDRKGWLEQAKVTHREFPQYVTGQLNLAKAFLYNNMPKVMLEVFGYHHKIGEMFPWKKVFHPTELYQFCEVWQHYYLSQDDAVRSYFFNNARMDVEENYDLPFDYDDFLLGITDEVILNKTGQFINSIQDKPKEIKRTARILYSSILR
ncbi:MAG TPA: hypothetical protein DDY13_11880 [Cytophagales bacterium]|jgi:hypothetical protein|nr:hypothetical protein [Cytophagales bacterium]